MNKTLSKHLTRIEQASKRYDESLARKAFKLFDANKKVSGIVSKLARDLENCEGGEYSFDDDGDFIYSVEVPDEILEYPFINDYILHVIEYGHLMGKKHNDLRIAQHLGAPITVNWDHEKGDYFVYDRESRKVIIDKRQEWMSESYVAAKIELYQLQRGCWSDVVEICSRYGSYEKHFNTHKVLNGKVSKEELEAVIDAHLTSESE